MVDFAQFDSNICKQIGMVKVLLILKLIPLSPTSPSTTTTTTTFWPKIVVVVVVGEATKMESGVYFNFSSSCSSRSSNYS